MAIPTNGIQLVRLAGAVFNQQLSAADYAETLAANKSVAELNAWANSAVAAEFKGKTTTDIAKAVLANVGLTSVTGLEAWLAGQLTAGGGVAKAGETMLTLLNDFSNMSTSDATYGAAVMTFNTKAAASQVLSQTAGTATGTYAAVSSVVVNTALTLTSATQTSNGTAGDDTFTAAAGTWGAGDVVNGGAGTDTLNATITGTGPTQSATSLVSVEVLNLTASPNPSTLDLTGVTGLTQVNNVSSANGATLSVTGLGNVVNTTITGGNTSTSIAYTTAGAAGTADAATLTLNGTTGTSASGSSFSTSGVETLTVNSATSANSLTSLTDTGITRLNITGSQALTVNGTVGGTTIATVDASAATGAITLATGAGAGGTAATGVTVTAPTAATAGLFTITTGANRDTVTLGAGTSVVSTGGGNDTINSGTGNTTITPGAGNDVVNAGAGVDTIRFDAAAAATNADTINNFGATDMLSINLGRAQVTGTSGSAATAVYGSLLTTNGVTATSPTFAGVSGTGAGTAIVFQTVAAGTSTANTIAQATNVVALTGVFTDGTAAGVITALGATGTTGVTTQLDSRFLLVTYSVGNIAQVWSYTGDNQTAAAGTSVLTDIDAAELTLVATLNGVASGSLTAANFSTYLDVAAATATASSGTGQTINIGTPLSQVTSTANTAGQFFTAAADTVNVAVGMLPNALASSTAGLTLLDDTAGDGDVLNVTALTAAAFNTATMGTFTNNIETVNMNLLIGGNTGFSAAANMPGTTTFGYTGTGAQTITALPASATIKFDAAASNAIAGTMAASGAFNVALNGSGVAPTTVTGAPTVPTLAMTSGTTSTTTVTGTSFLGAQTGSFYGSATSAATITGSGNLTISGTGATFDAQVGGVSTTGYSGSLTLRPTDATSFDLSGTGADTSKFTGVRTIDFSQTTGAGTVTLASDNGAWPVTVSSNASTFSANVVQAGSGLNDALVVTASLAAGNIGSISALGIETLTVNLGGTTGTTTSKSVGGITMSTNAATQAVTVNSNSSGNTLGTVTADSLNTSSIAGTVTATLANNGQGSAYTGPSAFASFITGTGMGDIVTTGSANDSIWVAATGNTTGSSNLNGGLGNDTYRFLHTTVNNSQITDTGGTDTLVLSGATANISGLNSGATLATIGIDVLVTNGAGAVTVASNQIGAQTINTLSGSAQTPAFTLAATGVLSVASATTTAAAVGALNADGTAITQTLASTGFILTGSGAADTITGSALGDSISIVSGSGVYNGASGNDTYFAATTVGTMVISDTAGTDSLVFSGTSENTTTLGGTTFVLMGIDQIIVNAADQVLTVAPGQLAGGALTVNIVNGGATGVQEIALGTAGVLDASLVTGAQGTSYVPAAGGAVVAPVAITGFTLRGTTTADSITGTTGADTIIGGTGIDVLTGLAGNDTYAYVGNSHLVTGNAAIDSIVDSAGTDRILFTDTAATVTIASTDILTRLTGVESIETVANTSIISITLNATNTAGTSFNHVNLSGDTDATGVNVISSTGANGITSITGSAGVDTMTLGAAAPATTVVGGAGADTLAMASGTTATITDGTIAVTITTGATVSFTATALTAVTVTGGTGVDTITLGAGVSNVATVTGGTGGDVINLGATTTGITSVTYALGDSVATIGGANAAGTVTVDFDTISNVTTSTAAANHDFINLPGTAVLAANAVVDGTDSTLLIGAAVVGQHAVSATGLATFVVANGGAAQVVTSDASLAAVLQYLTTTDIGNAGATLVFTATYAATTRGGTAHSFVYSQNTTNAANAGGATDGYTLIDFVGVTLIGLETTAGTTDLSLFIG